MTNQTTPNLDALVEQLQSPELIRADAWTLCQEARRTLTTLSDKNAKLVALVKRAIGLIADAEENTNWCGGDPYGDSASEQLQQALDALGDSHD